MKARRSIQLLALTLLLLGGITFPKSGNAQPNVRLTFQTFYHELSPYGRWTTSPQYGSVWSPYVSQDFQPYSTNGYWEMTEYGNTWISDYEWGWAAFHYGRWSFDDYLGWFWIPGYEWGPAWVNWRSGGGYYGWAPLGPGMNINVSINIPSFWWVFVPNRHFYTPNWHRYWVPRNRISRIYNQTTIINNYYRYDNRTYVYGPRRDDIERYTRRSVPVRDIVVNDRGRTVVNQSSRSNDRTDLYQRTPSTRNGATDSRYNGRTSSEYSSPRGSTNSGSERTGSRTGADYNVPERSTIPSNSRGSIEYNRPSEPNNSRSYPSQRQTPTRSNTESLPSRSTYEGRSSERVAAPEQNSSRSSRQPASRSYPTQESSSTPNVRSAPTPSAPSRSSRTESSPTRSRSSSSSERSGSSSERSSRNPQ
ncbi:DUF6600 domain-containing protein [Dyadobacter tibetensis]|uniref:DUF6600 domain-containing protein n=1 Tax=Dyadobacter tibetensis TaxID=1211851 RepID=UPI00046E76EC|nr:DUF6600 domain-containing protein [Dyadobacter tibetensis]